jgi:hypothetical protein
MRIKTPRKKNNAANWMTIRCVRMPKIEMLSERIMNTIPVHDSSRIQAVLFTRQHLSVYQCGVR